MMKSERFFALTLLLALASPIPAALAQSTPGFVDWKTSHAAGAQNIPGEAAWDGYFAVKQDLSAELTAIAGLSGTGYLTKTGVGAYALQALSGATLSAAAVNQLAVYAAGGTSVGGMTTCNNGAVITSGAGVPSCSVTLPSGIAATNMSLTTPTLGVASATTVNGQHITAGAGTLTLGSKTLTVSNTLTIAGTDGSTFNVGAGGTLPAGSAAYVPIGQSGATVGKLNTANVFGAGQSEDPLVITDAATITPDFAARNVFKVTLGGNRTLANPINMPAGQCIVIFIHQDATPPRTIASYGSYYKFPGGSAPALTNAANAHDVLTACSESTTELDANITGNFF